MKFNDPTEFIKTIAMALSKEGRVVVEETSNEEYFQINITTTNSEFGRIMGQKGKHIAMMEKIVQETHPGVRVNMEDARDNIEPGQRPVSSRWIVDAFMDMMRDELPSDHPMALASISTVRKGYCIRTHEEVDADLRVAIEHIFFCVGRALEDPSAIFWGSTIDTN